MSGEVIYERRGAAGILTINRPDRRNAIDGPTSSELLKHYLAFCDDEAARVLIVTGAGDHAFCAGADLKAIETLEPEARSGPLGFTRTLSPKPTIAAVHGYAVAGGFELALWCDLRIATRSAKFGCLERRWGVPLIDGGTQRLPRIVGEGRALDLVLTGRLVDAEEALAMGLANEVVEDGAHVDRALEIAELLAGFPQDTMLSDRRALVEGLGQPIHDGLRLEMRLGVSSLPTALAGANRFAEGAGRGGAPA